MSDINNGDTPASPTPCQDLNNGSGEMYCDNTGLTKREMFAMAAMQSLVLLNNPNKSTSKEAVRHADALLNELDK